MNTLFEDNYSLLSDNFQVEKDLPVPVYLRKHLGIPDELWIAELHYVPGLWIEDIQGWIRLTNSNVWFWSFRTPRWKNIALRYDLIPNVVSKFWRKKVGRKFWENKCHFQVPYMEEAMRRGFEIEKPLGFVWVGKNDTIHSWYTIVSIEHWKALREEDMNPNVAFLQWTIMRRMQDLGIYHAHPRIDNWLYQGQDTVRLVDGKGIWLDVDLPHVFRSWRTLTYALQSLAETRAIMWQHKHDPQRLDAYLDGYLSRS